MIVIRNVCSKKKNVRFFTQIKIINVKNAFYLKTTCVLNVANSYELMISTKFGADS